MDLESLAKMKRLIQAGLAEARVRNVVVDEAALLARTRTNRNPIKVEGELVKLISDGSFIRVVTR